jgi:IclR family transcriptional regulator, KDG regulon repressor
MPSGEIQVVNNVVALLDCFSTQQPELGVREAARLLKLSSSTTGRLLVAMKEAGLLTQNQQTRSYRLGGKVLAWAGVYSATFDLREQALPAIQELHRTTQETISLYVMEGDERMCVERMESPQNVRIVARVGRRLPLYAGSAGKLFLAFLPEARREEILRNTIFKPLTPYTITDPQVLRLELVKIRQAGYALSSGEWEAEAGGVAAPIFDQKGAIAAALTISGPVQRFTAAVIEQYIQLVTRAAAQISYDMGYYAASKSPVKEQVP